MRSLVSTITVTLSWSILSFSILLVNLFILYFYSIYSCDWPNLGFSNSGSLKALILTDVHLLGKQIGHPVDQFIREWEMSIAFRMVKALRNPEMIIFLGDELDEGYIASSDEFISYVERFKKIFPIEEERPKVYVTGNHDVGFHDHVAAHSSVRERFENAFNSSLANFATVKGHKFITLNSMAIEGNGVDLVKETEAHLARVQEELRNDSSPGRPIVLQHFPLYRMNDVNCHEIDSQEGSNRFRDFNPGEHCLSLETSEMILERFHPRLIFNGHIHSGCVVNHTKYDAQEWTVASFNWRNRDDPGYLLLHLTPDNHNIAKCILPTELAVLVSSLIGLVSVYIVYKLIKHSPSSRSERIDAKISTDHKFTKQKRKNIN